MTATPEVPVRANLRVVLPGIMLAMMLAMLDNMVVGTAIMGKRGEPQGDSLAGFAPDPDDAMIAAQLQKRFGENLFRSLTRDPFVIGLVLQAPLPKSSESRAQNFLLAAAKFMKNVDGAFASFVREARVTTRPATHPLVVLIFESKDDFDKYADSITGGQGLSANRIAGFYSGITNYLAIRMGECHTFDVPLRGQSRRDDIYVNTIGWRYTLRRLRCGFDVGYYDRTSNDLGDEHGQPAISRHRIHRSEHSAYVQRRRRRRAASQFFATSIVMTTGTCSRTVPIR